MAALSVSASWRPTLATDFTVPALGGVEYANFAQDFSNSSNPNTSTSSRAWWYGVYDIKQSDDVNNNRFAVNDGSFNLYLDNGTKLAGSPVTNPPYDNVWNSAFRPGLNRNDDTDNWLGETHWRPSIDSLGDYDRWATARWTNTTGNAITFDVAGQWNLRNVDSANDGVIFRVYKQTAAGTLSQLYSRGVSQTETGNNVLTGQQLLNNVTLAANDRLFFTVNPKNEASGGDVVRIQGLTLGTPETPGGTVRTQHVVNASPMTINEGDIATIFASATVSADTPNLAPVWRGTGATVGFASGSSDAQSIDARNQVTAGSTLDLTHNSFRYLQDSSNQAGGSFTMSASGGLEWHLPGQTAAGTSGTEVVAGSRPVMVLNVAPKITQTQIVVIDEGQSASAVVGTQDRGVLDPLNVSVAGQSAQYSGSLPGSPVSQVVNPTGTFSADRANATFGLGLYEDNVTRNYTVNVTDDDGAADTRSVQLVVRNVAPVNTLKSIPGTNQNAHVVAENSDTTVRLVGTDAGRLDTLQLYVNGQAASPGYRIADTNQHEAYAFIDGRDIADEGSQTTDYTYQLQWRDDDGAFSAPISHQVNVRNTKPTMQAIALRGQQVTSPAASALSYQWQNEILTAGSGTTSFDGFQTAVAYTVDGGYSSELLDPSTPTPGIEGTTSASGTLVIDEGGLVQLSSARAWEWGNDAVTFSADITRTSGTILPNLNGVPGLNDLPEGTLSIGVSQADRFNHRRDLDLQNAIASGGGGGYGSGGSTPGHTPGYISLGIGADDSTYQLRFYATDEDRAKSRNEIVYDVTVRNVAPTLHTVDTPQNIFGDNPYTTQIGEGDSLIVSQLTASDPGRDTLKFFVGVSEVDGVEPTQFDPFDANGTSGVRDFTGAIDLGKFDQQSFGQGLNSRTVYVWSYAMDDDEAVSAFTVKPVQVNNLLPQIDELTRPNNAINVLQIANFNAAGSDGDGDLSAYWSWDWFLATAPGDLLDPNLAFNYSTGEWLGAGQFAYLSGESTSFSYSALGTYEAVLRLGDGDGGFAYRYFDVVVVPEPTAIATAFVAAATLLRRRRR